MRLSIVENLDSIKLSFYDCTDKSIRSRLSNRDYKIESICRTKRAISSIISNNKFDYFYTQTFSTQNYLEWLEKRGFKGEKKCILSPLSTKSLHAARSDLLDSLQRDSKMGTTQETLSRVSFDYVKDCVGRISHYFSRFNIPNVLVYDLHRDNTLHIHGLVDLSSFNRLRSKKWCNEFNQNLGMKFVGYRSFRSQKLPVYANKLLLRSFGINSFVAIASGSVSKHFYKYLVKYITKAVNVNLVPKGERRYFCSKNLKRFQSIERYDDFWVKKFHECFLNGLSYDRNFTFENCDLYIVSKSDWVFVKWVMGRIKNADFVHSSSLSNNNNNCTQLSFF